VPGGPGMETARSAIHDCLHAIWHRTQTAKAMGWLHDASCPLDHLTPLLAPGLIIGASHEAGLILSSLEGRVRILCHPLFDP
jgi:hypothetical protein